MNLKHWIESNDLMREIVSIMEDIMACTIILKEATADELNHRLRHLQLLDCAGEDDEPLSTTAPIATNKPIITTKSPLPSLDTLLMLYCTLTCVGNHVYLLDYQ